MAISLKGKTVLATAAGQGIGRATALAFAAQGANVFATDINERTLESLGGEKGITTRQLDVLDTAAVNALAEEIGTVDVLFNCAGFVHSGTSSTARMTTSNSRSISMSARWCAP